MNGIYIKQFLLFMICLGSSLSSCQTKKLANSNPTETNQDYILEGQFKILDHDKLGNTYLVSKANEIIQLRDDKILFRYSNKRLGEISQIDVSNPQKILVYYSDYYQIVFLDNTLSEINRLDLEALGYWDIRGVALSRDNQIWIYDPTKVKLLKIDENGTVRLSSNELYDYGFSDSFLPKILLSNEQVIVYDEENLKIFDEFGIWKKNIPLTNEVLRAGRGDLILKQGNEIKSYALDVQFKDPLRTITDIPSEAKDFYLLRDRLFVIDDGGLFFIAIE